MQLQRSQQSTPPDRRSVTFQRCPCLYCLQAILQVALQVHADTILGSDELAACAERLSARLAATWQRLGGLLQSCSCMVGLLGNTQA